MNPTDHENDNRLVMELQQTWEKLEGTYTVSPATLDVWESLVQEQRRHLKRRLWREVILFWVVAVPLIVGFILLASGLSTWFWILQGLFVIAGIPLLIVELRGYPDKGETQYD
ncbi:YxlC family protein [Cohnella sp. WQ 127256]|uniref:YxlC family protein n=1 Tax=Cohnella sp. WQ 127256 TaxID=2938790 RepID=UPI00211907B6|nr:YxlC family protein [Cohnella sp. WQ 127256]